MRRKIIRYIFMVLSIAIMVLIFYFSSQDGERSGELSGWWGDILRIFFNAINMPSAAEFVMEYIRKFAHVFIYACLGLCVSICTFTFQIKRKWLWILIPIVICFFYACTDEFHQLYVNGRDGKFTDVLIDSIGFLFTIFLSNILWRLKNRHRA